MPLEEVHLTDGECMSWRLNDYKSTGIGSLKTVYPFDNVRKVGHISKNKGIVVWTLFNRQTRQFRKRPQRKVPRTKWNLLDVEDTLAELLLSYKSPGFFNKLRTTYIMGLPINRLKTLRMLADNLLIEQAVPRYIMQKTTYGLDRLDFKMTQTQRRNNVVTGSSSCTLVIKA